MARTRELPPLFPPFFFEYFYYLFVGFCVIMLYIYFNCNPGAMNIFTLPLQITINGNSIRYYRGGSGDSIIFIHGITTYSFIWRQIVPYFVLSYDVILIDLLGCGDSDKPLNQDISLKAVCILLAHRREFLQ